MPPLNSFQKSVLAIGIGQLVASPVTNAATITVNSNLDDGGQGCTLRQAIVTLNTASFEGDCVNSGSNFEVDDTINFNLLGSQIITLSSVTGGQLSIAEDKNITINGGGEGTITIDGGRGNRVFDVDDSALTLNNLTITRGRVSDYSDGGGIRARNSDVRLTNVRVVGNGAYSGSDGGGIYAQNSNVSLTNSTVSGNVSQNRGGGIIVSSDTSVSLTNSTVSGNTAVGRGANFTYRFGQGGGIFLEGGRATLVNSTVSGNEGLEGGGIYVDGGSLTLLNTTVAENSAPYSGGLFVDGAGNVKITNTILASNLGSLFSDCGNRSGTIDLSGGGNLLGSLSTLVPCGVFSIEGKDPLLGPLKNNGGATQTHALLKGSPAINGGTNPTCPSTDQRGRQRSDNACDIGAYEFIDSNFIVIPLPGRKAAIIDL